MCSRLVYTRHQQSHAIRTFPQHLSGRLRAIANLSDDPFDGDGAAISHFRGERLAFHQVGEYASVGGEACKGKTQVRIDADDLFLVR